MLGLLLFSYSSCSDQGCIEADDFGEYEQEVLTVKANALAESCDYRSDKSLIDIDQGDGLKTCFTSGTKTVTNESGVDATSNTGCDGFSATDQASFRAICIDGCRQDCMSSNSSDSSGAEPDWLATKQKKSGQNVGVTISPGSKVYIRAIGSVVLGADRSQLIFTQSTEKSLQSKDVGFLGSFVDLQSGMGKDVKFSGKWNSTNGSTNTIFGGNANAATDALKSEAFNGVRRLAAFIVPHPEGYSFDTKVTSESAGTKGVPLFADTGRWNCSYTGSSLTQSSCGRENISANPNLVDTVAQKLYGISSTSPTENFGKIGGMIRRDNDGLTALSDDPFGAATCNPNCPAIANANISGFIGDLNLTTKDIVNQNKYPVRVSFKNLQGGSDTSCNITLNFTILRGTVSTSHSVDNNKAWSTQYFELEPNDKMIFAVNAANFGGVNCGRMAAYRFSKINDIKIEKSGFVSFTRLGASGGSTTACPLHGRIINPIKIVTTNNVSTTQKNDPADFYEYDSFDVANASSIDPLANLAVPLSTSSVRNWSDKVFVRKGQTIRLDSTSWEGGWNVGTGVLTRQCGVGMAIKVGGINDDGTIDDRPAFLCRGSATSKVPNPLCTPTIIPPSTTITCKKTSERCGYNATFSAPQTPASFCPDTACQVTGSGYVATTCNKTTAPLVVTAATCAACVTAQDQDSPPANATTVDLLMDQCYNLEDYTGKVSNIPSTTGFSDAQLDNPTIAKGAKKLETFNGSYGNFENFSDTGKTESIVTNGIAVPAFNSNKIYHFKQQLSASTNGRLFFLIIDNDSFDSTLATSYANNGGSASSYNGLNGYKIDLSGRQEFKNGQWLEAILCRESSDTSRDCTTFTIPTKVNGQPDVITVANPVSAGDNPIVSSYYQFDPFGSILRTPNGTGVSPDIIGLSKTEVGDNFYRHSYYGDPACVPIISQFGDVNIPKTGACANNAAQISHLRMSFKIKDSEVANCDINSPSMTPLLNCVDTPSTTTHTYPPQCARLPDALGCSTPISTTVNKAVICGILAENSFYDVSVNGNIGTICGAATSIGSGTSECRKQFYCANKYYNNSGKYEVVVKVENKNNSLSNMVGAVISPVIEIMDGKPDGSTVGQAERVYKEIVGDGRFQAIVQLMVILMITFYGVGYLMGVSEFSQEQIVIRIIKIGVVYLFISPTGWDWFETIFVGLFRNGVDYVTFLMASSFDRSIELSNAIANNDFSDKSILFGGIDKVFGMFFSSAVQKKISALLFASIFGPIYLYIIYLSFFLYIYAVANAVLLYLTAQVFISILFVLGPIFFIMLLFNQTKDMFDKWLGELIGFSLQQIFLLTTLAFFNMMMYEVIKMALGYRICWDDVWVIHTAVINIKLLSFWTVASMPPQMNLQSDLGNIGNPEGIPSLFSILFIWVIASLMSKFIGFMTDLGASIGGSLQASAMAAGVKATAGAIHKKASDLRKSTVGAAIDSTVQSVDRALFDSGKKADKDRTDAKTTKTADRKVIAEAKKAEDKAASETRGTAEFAKLSRKDQDALIKTNKDAARLASFKEQGVTAEKDQKRVNDRMDGKVGYEGGSLTEMASNAWAARKDQSNKINTTMTGSEFKSATKDMTAEDKAKAGRDAQDGTLRVRTTTMERAKDAFYQGKENASLSSAKGVIAPIAGTASAALTAGKAARESIGNPMWRGIGSVAEGARGLFGGSDYNKATKESGVSDDKNRFGKFIGALGHNPEEKAKVLEKRQEIRESRNKYSDRDDSLVSKAADIDTVKQKEVKQEAARAEYQTNQKAETAANLKAGKIVNNKPLESIKEEDE